MTTFLYTLIGGLAALFCYRLGLREGRGLNEGKQIFEMPIHQKEDLELKRTQDILQNINAYNGTAKNQKEVK